MRTSFCNYYRKVRAFTLIELLVTIALIGILAALLLTALSSVRLKAQRIHCLSNVKQLALGSFMYASEHSRHAGVEAPAFPGGNWMGTLHEYASAKGILVCPSARQRQWARLCRPRVGGVDFGQENHVQRQLRTQRLSLFGREI